MVDLYQQIEELEKLVESESENQEVKLVEKEVEEEQDLPDVNKVESDKKAEPEKAEEPKAVEKAIDKQPETNAEWALQRRKMKQLAEAEAKIAELEKKAQEAAHIKPVEDVEPNKAEDYDGWLDWKLKQVDKKTQELAEKAHKIEQITEAQAKAKEQELIWRQAAKELISYEETFQKEQPDYEAVTRNGYEQLLKSYLNVEPWLSKEEAGAKVADFVMRFAAQAEISGVNPAKALYDYALSKFGSPQAQKEDVQTKQKTDLGKIDRNMKRSASPLAGGGAGSGGQITLESLNTMSNGELLNLDPSILRRLEQQAV